MPSESSLFFNRLSARSTGSPLRTSTSGIDNQLLTLQILCPNGDAEPNRADLVRQISPLPGQRTGGRRFLGDLAAQSHRAASSSTTASARPPKHDRGCDEDR